MLSVKDPGIEIQQFDIITVFSEIFAQPNMHFFFQIEITIIFLGKPAINTSPSSPPLMAELGHFSYRDGIESKHIVRS